MKRPVQSPVQHLAAHKNGRGVQCAATPLENRWFHSQVPEECFRDIPPARRLACCESRHTRRCG